MIPVLIYTLFTILLAWFNHKLISKGKRIYHGLNGLLHFSVAVVIGSLNGWLLFAATLFFVRAVFDSALNHFRHLHIGYISPNPKSIVDRLEKKLILFIVSKTSKEVIVNNDVRKVAVLLKILYVIVGITLLITVQ